MFGHSFVQVITFSNVKRIVFQALKNIDKKNIHAESEGFEPSIPFRVYTLSRRAPSTTRTTLQFSFSSHNTFSRKHSGLLQPLGQLSNISYSLKRSANLQHHSNTFSICILRDPLIRICAFLGSSFFSQSLACKAFS